MQTNKMRSEEIGVKKNKRNYPRPQRYFVHIIKRVILYALLIFFVFLTLLPLWSAVMTALKTQEALILSNPIEPPIKPSLDAFGTAFNELRKPILNSLMFTILATLLSCVLGPRWFLFRLVIPSISCSPP